MRLRSEEERNTDWLKGREFVKKRWEVNETQSAAPQVCDHRGRVKGPRYICVSSLVRQG